MKILLPLTLCLFSIITIGTIPCHADHSPKIGGSVRRIVVQPAGEIIVVNSNSDTNDAIPGDGVCLDALGKCSLRAAIQTSNDEQTPDTIIFSGPDPNYQISLTLGELTILYGLTISPPDSGGLWLYQHTPLSRAFYINSPFEVTLNRMKVMGNNALSEPPAGGIHHSGSGALNLNGVFLEGNGYGGLSNTGGALNISNCRIENNNSDGVGGLDHAGGALNISDSTIAYNHGGGSGNYISTAAPVQITRSTIYGNSSLAPGGGISVINSPSITITNSTIMGNFARYGGLGGGIYTSGSTLNLINTTVGSNNGKGSIYNEDSVVTLRNTIVADSDVDLYGSFISRGNNLIENSGTATGIIHGVNGDMVGVDPRLGNPGDNGGITLTQALLSGSPAINAGNNCVLIANGCGDGNPALPTDQRGLGRFGAVDIGSFEIQAATTPTASPVANADSYSVTAENTLTTTAPGVLGNDTDADNDVLTAALFSSPTNGSLNFNSDGSFSYTPKVGFSGIDSFTYKANDGSLDSNVATVSITVNPAPPQTPPNAPTGLTATVSKTQINLAWTDNSDNESGFKIELCGKGKNCGNAVEIAQVAANTRNYSVTVVNSGTSYSFRVRAFNGSGDSAYSNIATVATSGRKGRGR